jgi:hypothetical protein
MKPLCSKLLNDHAELRLAPQCLWTTHSSDVRKLQIQETNELKAVSLCIHATPSFCVANPFDLIQSSWHHFDRSLTQSLALLITAPTRGTQWIPEPWTGCPQPSCAALNLRFRHVSVGIERVLKTEARVSLTYCNELKHQ